MSPDHSIELSTRNVRVTASTTVGVGTSAISAVPSIASAFRRRNLIPALKLSFCRIGGDRSEQRSPTLAALTSAKESDKADRRELSSRRSGIERAEDARTFREVKTGAVRSGRGSESRVKHEQNTATTTARKAHKTKLGSSEP